MKLSIITPILNSHEIVRRQTLHYQRMHLPDDIEIIYIDDGSEPPIPKYDFKNFYQYTTHDMRPWTEHKARNMGARIAKGDYLIIIDIDYILPYDTIMQVYQFAGDRMSFKRYFGILNADGVIDTDLEILKAWRLKEKWIQRGWVSGHRSQFAIRKDLFWEIGGYREDLEGKAHPLGGGAGQRFFRQWQALEREGKVKLHPEKAQVYMFPTGKFCEDIDYNPFGLFHNLSRVCET